MRLALAMTLVIFVPETALAAAGTGLPWEGPLTVLSNSITGPVAFSVALIAIVIAGGVLIFGGDLNQFARVAIFIVLVLSLIIGAANFLSSTFGTTGALINVAQPITFTPKAEVSMAPNNDVLIMESGF